MDLALGNVISRGPNRYVDEAFEEMEEPPHVMEMVSCTSIEESIAMKQPEQSSVPMNPPSKIFIPIDQRKWNDRPSVASWESPLRGGSHRRWRDCLDIKTFFGILTEPLTGALCYLRCDVSSRLKVLESSLIFNGGILYIEEVTSQDFSITWIQTRISCTCESFKVTQEELWLIPLCWIVLKFHLVGKITWTMSKVH